MNVFKELLKRCFEQYGFARIERLCRQLGWSIVKRNANSLVLHCDDPFRGVRELSIRSGESVLEVLVFSFYTPPAKDVPNEVTRYLLHRNFEIVFGSWLAREHRQG